MKNSNKILVINAGGQYCHLIARRVREAGVHSMICSPESVSDELATACGVIISGGPSSVYAPNAPRFPPLLFESGVPILGLCYGHQVLADALGGAVVPGREREYGETTLEIIGQDTILQGLQPREIVWMSHGDEVEQPPPGFMVLAKTKECRVAAMGNLTKKMFGLQFHPEVKDTPCGQTIIENFLFKVCKCEKDWNVGNRVEQLKQEIRDRVGRRRVLFFVSGGVDSTVAFTLCTAALGPEQVVGVFVDTGFMRKNERQEIQKAFEERGWHNVRYVERSGSFLSAVGGECDPEKKRRLIGDAFLTVQREVELELGVAEGGWIFGQGTIYPDTIESGGSQNAALIKTHHNRVPAIEQLIAKGLVLEPLIEFYKDEVREIGRQLRLPETLVSKNPFPGPGLAVRCLCSPEPNQIEERKEVTDVVAPFDLNAWSVPLRTVGVQGDYRSYTNLVILSGDADLATYGQAARKITRLATNRVAFLVCSTNGDKISAANVLKRSIDMDRLNVLREADALSQAMVREAGFTDLIWQFPVILLPLSLRGGETIALRPISSCDAMTARYTNLPLDFIKRLGKRLLEIPGIDMVLYDVTDKPPATIEWE